MTSQKISVTVAGARTGLVGGCVPKGGALVSLENLNRILGVYHDAHADEWRISAETGVTLADLNKAAMTKSFPGLEKSNDSNACEQIKAYKQDPGKYFYPPDPTEMSASLGGTAATNASGARTYRYGPTRDWIRKIRVMTMTGEILDIPRGKYFFISVRQLHRLRLPRRLFPDPGPGLRHAPDKEYGRFLRRAAYGPYRPVHRLGGLIRDNHRG